MEVIFHMPFFIHVCTNVSWSWMIVHICSRILLEIRIKWFITEPIFAMQSILKSGCKFKFMTFCCNSVRSVKRALSK